MSHQSTPLICVLAAIAAILGCCQSHAESRFEKPNILLILTDDQGWPTLGCYGGTTVPTPNLDRLAAQGARLTNAYVTSQCTPTRATLLTGQYTARHGLWHVLRWYGYPHGRMTEPMFSEDFARETFTIAKGLRKAGYATGIVGKWHLTSNADGNYNGLNPVAAHHYGFDFAPTVLSPDEFAPGADRGVETLTSQAIEFITANQDRPWFCFLSHHMIHGKVVAPHDITQKYRDRGFGEVGPNRAVYLAGLECIDRSVGRLMDSLEQLGESNDTLVLFLSDNGGIDQRLDFKSVTADASSHPHFQPDMQEYDNAPLREGKGSVYEGGVRIPFIACWPHQIEPGTVVDTPVHAIDILPTCFELAGAHAPDEHKLDGKSLISVLKGSPGKRFKDRPLFQYYPFYDLRWGLTPSASIRKGDLKLIEFFGDRVDGDHRYQLGQRVELYDLSQDIGEEHNLAPTQPKLAASLRSELHNWINAIGAQSPMENPHYDSRRAFHETREKPEWLKDARWSPTIRQEE